MMKVGKLIFPTFFNAVFGKQIGFVTISQKNIFNLW